MHTEFQIPSELQRNSSAFSVTLFMVLQTVSVYCSYSHVPEFQTSV